MIYFSLRISHLVESSNKIVLKYKNGMRRYCISLFYQKRIRILSVSLWNAAMEIGNSFWYWALRLYSPMIWSHQAINCFSHTHSCSHIALLSILSLMFQRVELIQVILLEIDCTIFYTNLHELFCQFISWTNMVNSDKFIDNWWISFQVMADMKKSLQRSHKY